MRRGGATGGEINAADFEELDLALPFGLFWQRGLRRDNAEAGYDGVDIWMGGSVVLGLLHVALHAGCEKVTL